MMHPTYKFELTARGTTQRAYPIYGNDLAVDYEKETNQEFYRAKLSGKLTFVKADYDFIITQLFGTKFTIAVSVSRNGGQTWSGMWNGYFYITDCEVDEDEGRVVVTPSASDKYDAVLAGLDKEFNLIDLLPEIQAVRADKRPLIQAYVPGDNVLGCFLSGMWWEQECEAITNTSQLVNTYKFALNTTKRVVDVTSRSDSDPVIPDAWCGDTFSPATNAEFDNNGYLFRWEVEPVYPGYDVHIMILDGETLLWELYTWTDGGSIVGTYTLNFIEGVTSETLEIEIRDVPIYTRMLTDKVSSNSYPLPDDDLVADNRNYSRVLPYGVSGVIKVQAELSYTPTKWGIYKPGEYYQPPLTSAQRVMYPVARSMWSAISFWFAFSSGDLIVEEAWRQEFTIKDCYPVRSVISVLLSKLGVGVYHNENDSKFLYPWNWLDWDNPIDSEYDVELFLTPKSNVINSGYDQPAQKATITLGQVLDMLRKMYDCYWYIDGNQLMIEHIKFFRNGGSYSTTPSVGVDLTQQIVTRNGLPWAYETKKYQFDKPDMAARYQFKWMDDVTELFDGMPIEITSPYVNQENIEEVAIDRVTTDIDYILLNPAAVSEDGFVLLAAKLITLPDASWYYKIKYHSFTIDTSTIVLQNGYASFYYCETTMYGWDMPARAYTIGGESYTASGVKRLKWQNVEFPLLSEPDLTKLVKTSLGNGTIRKLSLSLTSRNAKTTLCYDTQ